MLDRPAGEAQAGAMTTDLLPEYASLPLREQRRRMNGDDGLDVEEPAPMAACEECGDPVLKEGHRFCSVRCRSVANGRRGWAKVTAEAPSPAPPGPEPVRSTPAQRRPLRARGKAAEPPNLITRVLGGPALSVEAVWRITTAAGVFEVRRVG